MMTAFIVVGALAVIAGLAILVTGIRHHAERQPKHVAMLIGGMMMTAFGIVIAGFAIAYQSAAPLDLNTGAAR
jgi:Ca2+/H+ antiporter